MKHIKFISLTLCAAFMLMLSGCVIKSPATVLNVDGTDIGAGLYLALQMEAYNTAYSLAEDKNDVLGGEIEGQNATDWMHDKTISLAKQYVYVNKQFDAEGLSLTDEELATLKSTVDSGYDSNSTWFSKNGIGKDSYYEYCLSAEKSNALSTKYSEENAPKDADIKSYMNDTYVHVNIMYLPITDDNYTSVDNDTLTKIKALADSAVTSLNKGESFDDVSTDTIKKAFELAGKEYTEDAAAGYITETFVTKEATSFDEAFTQKLFDAKEDEAMTVDDSVTPTIVQKIENFADDTEFDVYRDTLSAEMTTADFTEQLEAAANELPCTENASAEKTYSPKKIVVQ